jgi:hypothetical protein
MKLLQVRKEDKEDLFHQRFKLNHIIQLYEELEQSIEHIEIESINKKY